jgi:hypothetical protein
MPDEKEVELPNSVIKALFTLLMVAGILLYASWTIFLIVTKGIFFDIGLYSICIVMILGGLTGRLIYGYRAKTQAQ